jgi:hypothetical protein
MLACFQVKFSELSLDTFRMLQALEWEPSGSLYRTRVGEPSSKMSASGHVGVVEEIPDPSLPPNPHKYILYRPSVQHLLLVSENNFYTSLLRVLSVFWLMDLTLI